MMSRLDGLMWLWENEWCESVGNDRVDSERYERENECGNEMESGYWMKLGWGWKFVGEQGWWEEEMKIW